MRYNPGMWSKSTLLQLFIFYDSSSINCNNRFIECWKRFEALIEYDKAKSWVMCQTLNPVGYDNEELS